MEQIVITGDYEDDEINNFTNGRSRLKVFMIRAISLFVLATVSTTIATAQNAVTVWNTIAAQTAVRGKSTPGMTGIFLAYSSLAAFDAVNAIHPRFQPYAGNMLAAPPGASESAAVTAAVHDVLVHYFAGQAASDPTANPPFIGLDEKYSDYLASLTESAAAVSAGVRVGQQAAAALIALRDNDGIFGVNTYLFKTPGPGVYQPTPPLPYPGAQTPWIANMKPFTMHSPSQFRPDEGPTPLYSEDWAKDYKQTKAWGSLINPLRNDEQTTIGLFWTANAGPPYTGMLRQQPMHAVCSIQRGYSR